MKPAIAVGALRALAPALWVISTSAAQAHAETQPAAERYDWFAVPLVGYSTENGLGFGVRTELAKKTPDCQPHRFAVALQAYASSLGFHYHQMRYDDLALGGHRRLRLTVNAVYRQWGNNGYWGIGNQAVRERQFVGEFATDDPRRQRYRYALREPFVHGTVRYGLLGSWAGYVAVQAKWSRVDAAPGSLLGTERPRGFAGGWNLLLGTGVLYDSRRPEADPSEGTFAEVSPFVAVSVPSGTGPYGGAFVSGRAYWSLASFWVVASRIMAEWMFGPVPFTEMVHWHGSVPIAGFGGGESARGFRLGRWRAPHKAVGSLESRFRVVALSLFDRPLAIQLGLFGDAGMVWGGQSVSSNTRKSSLPVHATFGTGLRLVFAESFVARLDAAFGKDPILEPTGAVSHPWTRGLYLTFGQAF